jgi:uncharacterized protein (TIGR00730 family)
MELPKAHPARPAPSSQEGENDSDPLDHQIRAKAGSCRSGGEIAAQQNPAILGAFPVPSLTPETYIESLPRNPMDAMAKKPAKSSRTPPARRAPRLHVAPLSGGKGANAAQMASPTYRLAALDQDFLLGDSMRGVRFMLEYAKAEEALDRWGVHSTVVVFGSSRFGEDSTPDHRRWYNDARTFARIVSERGGALMTNRHPRENVIATGGGPGIMEAANRGASEAKGVNVGLTISIPVEEFDNPYVTRELAFHFHYFFMRKFWFAYLAKAVIVFPGGFGTLDELFELLTLVQTKKMTKPLPIVLFGDAYWREVVDFDALVRHGTISPRDVDLVYRTDSVDEAYDWIVLQLAEHALGQPGPML